MRSAAHASLNLNSTRLGLSRLFYSIVLSFTFILSFQSEEARAETSARKTTAYKEEEVDTPPRQKEIRVHYSRSARREHAQVTLRFVVTKDGKVDQLTIVKFTDPEIVDEAYEGYSSAEFFPGIKDGRAVDTWIEVTDTAK